MGGASGTSNPIRNTAEPLRQTESHSTNILRNPGFGRPLSQQHYRQAPRGSSPFVATSDSICAEESMDCWVGKKSAGEGSSSSDRKGFSMPALSQMPPLPSSQPTIEISPGIRVRLRGADETLEAISNDFYLPAECICCESTIFCIQNADYVLCPDCRVVSRMEGLSSRGMGGVGLGFKFMDLAQRQNDIILRDELRRRPQAPIR
jgi:hypothetical protein